MGARASESELERARLGQLPLARLSVFVSRGHSHQSAESCHKAVVLDNHNSYRASTGDYARRVDDPTEKMRQWLRSRTRGARCGSCRR
jgi:hypothetical protein